MELGAEMLWGCDAGHTTSQNAAWLITQECLSGPSSRDVLHQEGNKVSEL